MAPLFCAKWGCGCFVHFWHLKWLNYSKCFHLTVKIIPPQICQKDQSRPVQDWSLIPAQNVRTRANAVWFWAGPGPHSSPKSVQSSPVLSLSLVLGPDLQTLTVPGHWQAFSILVSLLPTYPHIVCTSQPLVCHRGHPVWWPFYPLGEILQLFRGLLLLFLCKYQYNIIQWELTFRHWSYTCGVWAKNLIN